jgi:hypothetical protein
VLEEAHASKGSRNALKKLDYDIVKLQRVDYLSLIFNGDVVFEFLQFRSSIRNFQAKLMVGMDKQHDGHTWTKTITSHIKNDMDLMLCTSSCACHLWCDNQNCEYLNRVNRNPLLN